jgi:hypothetical protein
MKHRQELICWNCDEQYGFPLPQEEVASFIAKCPFCDYEGVVDLSEIPKSKDILRNNKESQVSERYILPDLIKTKPVEEE